MFRQLGIIAALAALLVAIVAVPRWRSKACTSLESRRSHKPMDL
jgi:LPS O-antigen subunit length determinant protein (WzzB/FepE family)